MNDKIVLVTGATGGIGRVTAETLARDGVQLVLVGRDPQRTEQTADEIRKATANPNVSVLLADLSSMEAVRRAAAEFRSKFDRLDVLVNNAGAIYAQRETTVDGFERTFATNHLAPFLLTNLLLEPLKASPSARVVTVASELGRVGKLHFDDLMLEQKYGAYRAYNQSKLANIAFSLELAERLRGTRVTSNSLHPGVIASGFGQNSEGWLKRFVKLGNPFMLTPEKGARTSVFLARAPEVEGVTGNYFVRCKPVSPPAAATKPENRSKLWEVSARLTRI